MSKFYLRIITPVGEFFSGKVEYLSVDTPSGREGFMRGALCKLAVLSAGRITVDDGERTDFVCGNGFISVEKDGVTLITSECDYENADDKALSGDFERESDYAKARLVSGIAKIKKKHGSEER